MIEAMKQVLDAWQTSVYGSDSHHRAMLLAITSMVKAIEQAGKQEPVAWMNVKEDMTYLNRYNQDDIPLYMHSVPPKPEWVSLTDEDIGIAALLAGCDLVVDDGALVVKLARAIESKLRKKNHEMSNL